MHYGFFFLFVWCFFLVVGSRSRKWNIGKQEAGPAVQRQVQGCALWLTPRPERRKRSKTAAVLQHAASLLCQPSVIPPDRRVTAHFTKHAITGTETRIRKKEGRKEAARWGKTGKAGIGPQITGRTDVSWGDVSGLQRLSTRGQDFYSHGGIGITTPQTLPNSGDWLLQSLSLLPRVRHLW